MTAQVIVCPKCKTQIPLNEAISHQIREELQKEMESATKLKEQELQQRTEALAHKELELQQSKDSVGEQVQKQVQVELTKLQQQVKQKAEADVALKVQDLSSQVEEQKKKLDEANAAELALRKEKRELEERAKNLELEVARKLDEERDTLRRAVLNEAEEKHKLKDLDNDKKLGDLRREIEELQRKSEQGSQQFQGEVLELDVEAMLKEKFPHDRIEPVPKGITGADVIQKVYTPTGLHCGTIAWESKRTKNWSNSWVDKLKDDQRAVGAEIAVIVSVALPEEVRHFGFSNGIWISDHACAYGVAVALRANLIEVATTKLAAVGKNEKTEMLYNYLTGPQFRQKVEAVVETFIAMRNDLDQEKRAMIKIWSKRAKQIDRVANNMSSLHGDLQAIAGAALPEIPQLELKALPSSEAEEEHIGEESALELPL
jgi:hypothetical protein